MSVSRGLGQSCDWETAGKGLPFSLPLCHPLFPRRKFKCSFRSYAFPSPLGRLCCSSIAYTFLLAETSVEKEDFSRIEARQKAIAFLDNPELLMMYAQSTGDESVPPSP